ncbi:dihydrodipicolinate synthase family protein [Candidatus Laterigemmans baculatus]|nr:dihydrodipicolinate synthase family protein [Candidatus Laterigemmans baculatus]
MSAILLPLLPSGDVDWNGFRGHVRRTLEAGLVPAVNMDTGYANLISDEIREQALRETAAICGDTQFVAGAYVGDAPGSAFALDAYRTAIDQLAAHGGTPIVFQSFGLTSLGDDELIAAYEALGRHAGEFLAFELGSMFAPFGRIYSLEVYERLIRIPQCRGAKHSSLSRTQEWARLAVRDAVRPEFRVLTGNDLAIDMVMYGSDYLLGLSTFDPAAFAVRDAFWQAGDARFYELNDLLQYLGMFAFRSPVPAYKHNAAQFLHERGWIASAETFPGSPKRPDSDIAILREISERLAALVTG